MKNILIIAVVGLVLASCARDRYEIFDKNNVAPAITLSQGEPGNDGVWKVNGRIKLGLKTSPVPINLLFSGTDQEGTALNLNAVYEESLRVTFTDGAEVDFPLNISSGEDVSLQVLASKLGVYKLELILTDELGKSSKANISLDVFENMPPVAVLTKEPQAYGIPSPNVYQINGDESYDQDQQWGGTIRQYIWRINNGNEFITEVPYFRQALEPGGYSVTLRVIDSDGVESPEVSQVITIR